MAEDDEVDVLGDFSFDVLSKNESIDGTPLVSQNSDLLNCDYTIHPQWLLDKPSANPALWYDTSDIDPTQYDFPIETILPQQNSITDESGWTEKEKDLLNRGIEIFGKSNVNLSQFIGSRTPAEVKYFLKNFYTDVQLSYSSVNEDIFFDPNCVEETVYTSTVLQDNEIPASIEQVIASVSTAKPTTPIRKRLNNIRKTHSIISYENIPSGQSLLKSSYIRKPDALVFKTKNKSPKVKFKTKLKFLNKNIKPEAKKKVKAKLDNSKIVNLSLSRSPLTKEEVKKDLRIVTGTGLGVPVCEGEEVVKIIKENDVESGESDVEIDIEDNNDEHNCKENSTKNQKVEKSIKLTCDSNNISVKEHFEVKVLQEHTLGKTAHEGNCMSNMSKVLPKGSPQLEGLPKDVLKELLSTDYPQHEVILSKKDICDVEKFLFFEFFEGRPTKTLQRYLHIRNHILDTWKNNKTKYLRKTTIRNGLKQAGDVNLVGRIHSYLEQIGAINFGFEETKYCRPLLELATVSTTPKEIKKIAPKVESAVPRQRIKKKYTNDGEGGYTLTHDEKGQIINTTVVNEEPAIKQRTYLKRPAIQLIYCRPFNDNYQQKYSITLDISTLILMDLHAHMYLTEVMGLIGGVWNPFSKKLFIKRYVPCKNIASSLTHCDMCPMSQARAADLLHSENLDILGWYHSHPTFAPEPSHQDMDTQLSVQQWIGSKTPCVGFILSPFSLHGALIASPYRCMIVHKGDDDTLVPYKFKIDLQADQRFNIREFLEKAKRVYLENNANMACKSRVDFTKAYFQDNSITYLDKYIYSVKMHLAKCSDINKMTCDAIISGLSDIFINK